MSKVELFELLHLVRKTMVRSVEDQDISWNERRRYETEISSLIDSGVNSAGKRIGQLKDRCKNLYEAYKNSYQEQLKLEKLEKKLLEQIAAV